MVELEENVIYFLVEIYIFEISACKNKKRRSVFFFFFLKMRYLVQRARFLTKKNKTTTTKRNPTLQRKAGGILHSFSCQLHFADRGSHVAAHYSSTGDKVETKRSLRYHIKFI